VGRLASNEEAMSSKKKRSKEFIKLENRLRRLTSDQDVKAGKFLRAQTRELAKKANAILRKLTKGRSG
jgi:hypothetical protein